MDDKHIVFDMDRLPKRNFRAQQIIANRYAVAVGQQIEQARYRLSRQIAELCVKHNDLVEIVTDGPFLKIQADCIVLTQEELADLMRKQFKAGLEHARGFMPVWESSALAAKPAQGGVK